MPFTDSAQQHKSYAAYIADELRATVRLEISTEIKQKPAIEIIFTLLNYYLEESRSCLASYLLGFWVSY